MGKTQTHPITIDGIEYDYNDLTEEQQALFNHCVDLDRKIGNTQFNLDQLMVGKEAFITRLKASLEAE
jgi:hypothetical protein